MSPSGFPQPTVNDETRPFWEALQEGRFVVQRCRRCGAVQHYYRTFCATCWSEAVEDVDSSATGTVWSSSVIVRNRAAGFADLVPYVVAVVELDEGVRVIGRFSSSEREGVPIGTRVRLTFPDPPEEGEQRLPELIVEQATGD